MRPPNLIAREKLTATLRRGPIGAPALSQALAVSPRTALRLIAELGHQCVVAGRAGRRRYALARVLRNSAKPPPVFTIDQSGKPRDAGSLDLIAPEGARFDLGALGWPIDSSARDGWWDGLPYPFYDMRPQGFLGRAFARREHRRLEVSLDPREWSDDDVIYVLSRRGNDSTGNLIIGERALRLHQDTLIAASEPLKPARPAAAYSRRADETVALGIVGSSAAGEFPKFTAMREWRGIRTPQVIVKFAGRDRGATTTRWADLLICEHLALEHASRLPGITAARTRILQTVGRTFLEAERFDRHGASGRSPLISLDVLSAHLLGLASQDWREHARGLARLGLIDATVVTAITRLWWFGRLIANGDMHLGNLSFVPHDGQLSLAPAYDMLPMTYAPLPGGEVPPREPVFDLPLPVEADAWHAAATNAIAFWREAASDTRMSSRFRSIAAANARALERRAQQA